MISKEIRTLYYLCLSHEVEYDTEVYIYLFDVSDKLHSDERTAVRKEAIKIILKDLGVQ